MPAGANLSAPAALPVEDGLERNHCPFGMKGFPERGDRVIGAPGPPQIALK